MNFFGVHFTGRNRPFWTPAIFYFDGWMVVDGGWWMVDGGGWWMDGQRKSKKIMYFKNFSNTIQYFLLVVSRPLRRVFKK